MWDFVRPFAWSALRHGVTAGGAYLAAKGIFIDEATANGVSNAAMQGLDILAVGAIGAGTSVFTSLFKR
jgi:hypothetical protein